MGLLDRLADKVASRLAAREAARRVNVHVTGSVGSEAFLAQTVTEEIKRATARGELTGPTNGQALDTRLRVLERIEMLRRFDDVDEFLAEYRSREQA